MNALFGDTSSVWYVNEELAGVLGLSVKYEEVTVNVLMTPFRHLMGCCLK